MHGSDVKKFLNWEQLYEITIFKHGINLLASYHKQIFIRHPIYVGIAFTHFGLFSACGSIFGIIYTFILIIPLNVIRAQLEEKAMFAKFGDCYRIYHDSTWF